MGQLARRLISSGLLAIWSCGVQAETARIAVATNFAPTAERLAADYAAASGNTVEIVGGATGKLYAQIVAGAPFDGFLSADEATPAKLAKAGFGVAGSQFIYATGQLALWSADATTDLADPLRALKSARQVAIANPDLAPYGKAAAETLAALGLPADLEGRVVTGENIGQAQTLVASGAADLGFVATSGVIGKAEGVFWAVPAEMHKPIRQSAILLQRGRKNSSAAGFFAYLAQPEAKAAIKAAGYLSE